jgi:hypothetical protein
MFFQKYFVVDLDSLLQHESKFGENMSGRDEIPSQGNYMGVLLK